MPRALISELLKVWIEMGTSSSFSARLRAVTTTVSTAVGALAAADGAATVCAWACAAMPPHSAMQQSAEE